MTDATRGLTAASRMEEVAASRAKELGGDSRDNVAMARDRVEVESEASTAELVNGCSEASVSDMASSHGGDGDVTPRGAGSAEIRSKPAHLPIRPRWSDICVEDGLLDCAAFDIEEELLGSPTSPDCSPKSPTKGARRAARRRRRREEAKAVSTHEVVGSPARGAAHRHGGLGGVMPTIQVMLPSGALGEPNLKALPISNCTPTCVASPARGGAPRLPIAPAGGVGGAAPCSPCRPTAGAFMTTAPQGSPAALGDASTRTPTGACASPYMRGNILGTDASARTPTAGPRMPTFGAAFTSPGHDAMWAVVGSPTSRAAVAGAGIVSTSPVGSAAGLGFPSPVGSASMQMSNSPMGSASMVGPGFQAPASSPASGAGGGAAGSAAADALRALLGPAGMPSGHDLAAKLRAAAPETYED